MLELSSNIRSQLLGSCLGYLYNAARFTFSGKKSKYCQQNSQMPCHTRKGAGDGILE
jgi:hypothetical protein